jgi:hypothetical protein
VGGAATLDAAAGSGRVGRGTCGVRAGRPPAVGPGGAVDGTGVLGTTEDGGGGGEGTALVEDDALVRCPWPGRVSSITATTSASAPAAIQVHRRERGRRRNLAERDDATRPLAIGRTNVASAQRRGRDARSTAPSVANHRRR